MSLYRKQGRRYVPVAERLHTTQQACGFDGLMATSAVRYCLGRRTYIATVCADWLVLVWESLPENVQRIIQRDVEEAFAKDDAIRADPVASPAYRPLGDDCDRREWERVRKLWEAKP